MARFMRIEMTQGQGLPVQKMGSLDRRGPCSVESSVDGRMMCPDIVGHVIDVFILRDYSCGYARRHCERCLTFVALLLRLMSHHWFQWPFSSW